MLSVCLRMLWLAGRGSNVVYTVDKKKCSGTEEAVRGNQSTCAKTVVQIKPSHQPLLPARVLVALPSRKLLLEKGIKHNGVKFALPLESYDFIVKGRGRAKIPWWKPGAEGRFLPGWPPGGAMGPKESPNRISLYGSATR
jgi:hypothetical protein